MATRRGTALFFLRPRPGRLSTQLEPLLLLVACPPVAAPSGLVGGLLRNFA
jgi:hypothetical protein